jgi:hypothetical protein
VPWHRQICPNTESVNCLVIQMSGCLAAQLPSRQTA